MIKDCISFPTNSRQLLSYNPYSFTLTQNSELDCGSDAAWEKLSSEESIWLIGMTSKHLRVFNLNMGSTNFNFNFFFFSRMALKQIEVVCAECFDTDWLKRKTHTRPSLTKQKKITLAGDHAPLCPLIRPAQRNFTDLQLVKARKQAIYSIQCHLLHAF